MALNCKVLNCRKAENKYAISEVFRPSKKVDYRSISEMNVDLQQRVLAHVFGLVNTHQR